MRFSASRSPLLASPCSYWLRPDVTAPEAESGTEARVGTVAWARVAAAIMQQLDPGNGTLSPEESRDADDYTRSGIEWAKPRARMGWRCEVKFAWSPSRDEGRELPPTAGLRDYSDARGDEVCGSVDIVYFDSDGTLCVDDIKTGVTPLEQYVPQIRTLGLFAARAYGTSAVRVRLVKLHKDRAPDEWQDTLDAFALDAIAESLADKLAAAAADGDAAPKPMPGPHCNELFCPARLVCPEVPATIAELVPAEALVRAPRLSAQFISHDHDAAMLDFLRIVEAAAKDLRGLIKARTPEGGVKLSDGRTFREGFHDETRWRQESLIATVRELGAKAGMSAEDVDRALESCRYTFQKSEGLRVTGGKRSRKEAA